MSISMYMGYRKKTGATAESERLQAAELIR